jgi:tight adherence protein C
MTATAFLPLVVALGGLVALSVGIARMRQPAAADPAAYLRQLDDPGLEDADEFSKRLNEPFIGRAVRPLLDSVLKSVGTLTPRGHVDRVHQKLLVAGLSQSLRAEEFVTLQIVATGVGVLLSALFAALGHPSSSKATLAAVLFVGAGAAGPYAWLARTCRARQESIFKDLPDVLDLLAISVEAGVGFEGAMDVVCTNFTSPLALEFSRTLKEMELGLSRREALQNLKRRTEVPELSNFVLAITQADALGMPLGRVLHTQAAEMRNKRRQWAREKAGKLPVKILFPLVVFIFPAILVVILGPAGKQILTGLK